MAINRLHMCMIFIQILLTRGKKPLWKRPQIQCPYCDPNYIDVPNMQSAMQGYDLPMGDPNCNARAMHHMVSRKKILFFFCEIKWRAA